MAIVQEAFDIPEDIMMKILSGEYQRFGGVVRYAIGHKKGRIVTFLDPAKQVAKKQAANVGARVLKQIKTNRKVQAGLGLAAVGTAVFIAANHKKRKLASEFTRTLKQYCSEIKQGTLAEETIDRLMMDLNEIEKDGGIENLRISLSGWELAVLLQQIQSYTQRLAELNNVELADDEKDLTGESIIDIRKYLKIQKRIFETAS